MSRPASLPEGGGARRAGALSALIPILAGCLSGAGEPPVAPGAAPPVTTAAPARPDPVFGAPAPQPAPPSRQDPAEPVGPLRREEPARPPEFEGAPPAADASVLLRHRVDATRRLVYAGVCEDEVLAGVGEGANESVIKRSWRVARRHLLLGSADGAPAEMVSSSLEELAAATWAGRDALTDMRSRPWNGRRLGSGRRRFSERGVEPLPSDTSPDQFLEPLPEFPRLPRGRLTAAAPLVESVAPYQVEWRLTGAGTLGKRRCWQATRTVSRPSGGRPAPADLLGFQDEYLLDAADGTVLRVRRTSARPAGFMGHIRELSLALVEDTPEAPAAFDREAREAAETSRLLGAIGERRPDLAVELAARSSAPVRDGPAAALARRYADGEKALAEARGGARRVDLVPEDTYVLLWAPEKLGKGVRLVPVVFFHGAGANPQSYFRDWEEKSAADRPLLLVFPRSRSWTWQLDADGAVVGSLLERLGRTYELDRDRLVLAGHGMGAELAYALAYGAEFPGFRVRGIVPAGGTMSQKDENMRRLRSLASDGKHEELAAKVRFADVLALAGEEDRLYPLKDYQNTDRWLRSFNPKGVELLTTPKLGQQYSPDWTPVILDWIGKLKPPPAADGRK